MDLLKSTGIKIGKEEAIHSCLIGFSWLTKLGLEKKELEESRIILGGSYFGPLESFNVFIWVRKDRK